MPRLSITSNLKEFPREALLEASTIIEILAETNDQELSKSSERSISYSIDTKTVILTDNIFHSYYDYIVCTLFVYTTS